MQSFEWRISNNGNQCLDANGCTGTVYQDKNDNYRIVITAKDHDPVFGKTTYYDEAMAKIAIEEELGNPKFALDQFAYSQKWRTSKTGNQYCIVDGECVTIFQTSDGGYKYVKSGEFSTQFATLHQAKTAVDGLCKTASNDRLMDAFRRLRRAI